MVDLGQGIPQKSYHTKTLIGRVLKGHLLAETSERETEWAVMTDFLNMSNLMAGDDLVASSESLKAGWGSTSWTSMGPM